MSTKVQPFHKVEQNNDFANVSKALFNSTHAILFQAVNKNGKEKQAVMFVNCREPWFEHFFNSNDKLNDLHKLEHIHAYSHNFLNEDKSIAISKATAYKLKDEDYSPFINWSMKKH